MNVAPSSSATAVASGPIRPRQWTQQDIGCLAGSVVSGFALTWLLFRVTPFSGVFGYVLVWFAAFSLIYWLVLREVDGPLLAADRVWSVIISSSAVIVLIPLVTIIVFVTSKGIKALRPGFFTGTLESVGPLDPATAGGALHAIVGTFQQVGLAVLMSVPLGVMAAVFLNEVGGRLVRPVRFMVDAMSGVPSIVAGLFIYAVWLVGLGASFSGFAAALALSILMLPTVIRTSEEMLRLVPGGLREASLALGAPEWRTTLRVVLPTARAGLVTAIILGVARAVGETAPLIMTSFGSAALNLNPFSGSQASLPLFIYFLIRLPQQSQIDRAWTGAFVLITLVLVLFTLARVLGSSRGHVRLRRSTASKETSS